MNVMRLIRNAKNAHREKQLSRLRARSDDREKERLQLAELKKYEKEKAAIKQSKKELHKMRTAGRRESLEKVKRGFKKFNQDMKQRTTESNNPFKPTTSDNVRDIFGSPSGGNVFTGNTEKPKKERGQTIVIKVK